MSEQLNIVISHTLWHCNCQSWLAPHRIEAKETVDTNQVLCMTIQCLNCKKETYLEFNNEKIG